MIFFPSNCTTILHMTIIFSDADLCKYRKKKITGKIKGQGIFSLLFGEKTYG